jgi:L-threonylcarbamoyladenylate synthase
MPSTSTYDCTQPSQRAAGVAAAVRAVRGGRLVVLPTDTVYGIGCDAFAPASVRALLAAKGRGPDMPVPVLIGSPGTLEGIATGIDERIQALTARFWPGALTLICRHQPSLAWDLGDTQGTVAVRMPDHPVAVEVLTQVGPMAVSSANLTGSVAPQTCAAALADLGEAVEVYLDAGPTPGQVASTIVDLTAPSPRLIREGGVTADALRELLPDLVVPED